MHVRLDCLSLSLFSFVLFHDPPCQHDLCCSYGVLICTTALTQSHLATKVSHPHPFPSCPPLALDKGTEESWCWMGDFKQRACLSRWCKAADCPSSFKCVRCAPILARTHADARMPALSLCFSVVYFWFPLLVFSISNNFIKTRPPSYRSLSLTRARSLALFSVCSSPKVSHAIRRAILLSFSSLFSSSSSSALQPLLLRLALLFSKY